MSSLSTEHYQQYLKVTKVIDHYTSVTSLAFSSDGKYLVIGSHSQNVFLFNLEKDTFHILSGQKNDVLTVAFSSDDRYIASGSLDGTVIVWDANTYKILHIFTGHEGYVYGVAFHPNNQKLVSGSHDQTVREWNLVENKCMHVWQYHNGSVRSVCYTPDGAYLLSASEDSTIRVMNDVTKEQTCLKSPTPSSFTCLAVHPSSTYFLSGGGNNTIYTWKLHAPDSIIKPTTAESSPSFQNTSRYLKPVNSIECPSPIRSLAFTPQGDKFACAMGVFSNLHVQVWNVIKQGVYGDHFSIRNYKDSVLSVKFSPDGTKLAVGGYEKKVQIHTLQ